MATISCSKCGALWDTEKTDPAFNARLFSTANNPVGSFVSLGEIIASGEAMLSCPSDPIEPLDSVIQENYSGPRSSARVTGISTRGGGFRGL